MFSVIVLAAIVLRELRVMHYAECGRQCCYAQCHCAGCNYSERRYTAYCLHWVTVMLHVNVLNVNSNHNMLLCNAECHYSECHYAECCNAVC
jgi:hypothetical protein